MIILITSFKAELDCGRNTISEDQLFISGVIVDVEKNPVGHWPWMASIGYMEGNEWVHQCGSTLISQNTFLTAAHCANKRLV
jgi:V8-like Glu-specific endopeptidase